jgi:transcriptional regulator with XRE-family HTH domain
MTSEVIAALRDGARFMAMPATELTGPPPVGSLLREWRERRRMSQLDLALEAGVSARHLSFLETGRSRPSQEMVLRLADQLEVPLRDRNGMLLAAGYAPVFPRRELDDPEMAPIREAIDRVLTGHEPYPAMVVDREWELIAGNRGMAVLVEDVDPQLLEPPVNVLRIALHPDGMAKRILNLGEWRAHILDQLRRQVALSADPSLAALYDELVGYPGGDGSSHETNGIVVPLRLTRPDGAELQFISTVMTFGTAVDVTLAELVIEAFLPGDAATAAAMRAAVDG